MATTMKNHKQHCLDPEKQVKLAYEELLSAIQSLHNKPQIKEDQVLAINEIRLKKVSDEDEGKTEEIDSSRVSSLNKNQVLISPQNSKIKSPTEDPKLVKSYVAISSSLQESYDLHRAYSEDIIETITGYFEEKKNMEEKKNREDVEEISEEDQGSEEKIICQEAPEKITGEEDEEKNDDCKNPPQVPGARCCRELEKQAMAAAVLHCKTEASRGFMEQRWFIVQWQPLSL